MTQLVRQIQIPNIQYRSCTMHEKTVYIWSILAVHGVRYDSLNDSQAKWMHVQLTSGINGRSHIADHLKETDINLQWQNHQFLSQKQFCELLMI
jgi:hypothetical protein